MPLRPLASWARRFSQPGVVLGTLVLAGLVGLIGGGVQLRAHIFKPFEGGPALAVPRGAVEATQTMDTDQDGLTDYLEINVYDTSPYVPDSDSDGQTDGQEVAAGTDPNCPAGTDCSLWNATAGQNAENQGGGTVVTTTGQVGTQTELTSAQLRQLLIQGGLAADQVNSLTEEQLRQAWQQAIEQAQEQ